MSVNIKVGGVWKQVTAVFVRVGGTWKQIGGVQWAVFNEGSSPSASFSTLSNPDGNGINYRIATYTSSGTLALSTAGRIEVLLVGAGGNGGTHVNPGLVGGGGGAGGLVRVRTDANTGTYTVTRGAANPSVSATGQSSIFAASTGGFQFFTNSFVAAGGGGGAPDAGSGGSQGNHNAGAITLSNAVGLGAGPAGSGFGGGGGGAGGNGSGRTGGVGLSLTGWSPSSQTFGVGGPAEFSASPAVGSGGTGSRSNSFGVGQGGIVVVRSRNN